MEKFCLVGIDSNAFSVIYYVVKAMKKVKFNESEIKQYKDKCFSSDYDNLLAESQLMIDKCNEKYSKKSNSIPETDYFAKFGPGKYFIGDICYALPDKIYDEVWGDTYKYADGCYEKFAVHRTAYGDGCYPGTDGNKYLVDAGNIGITNITEQQKYDNERLNNLGTVVEVKDSIIMYCDDNCNFTFVVDGQSFEIITGDFD